jgi:WD40 repeat protein
MSLAFSPDGRTLASAGEGGGLKLWHVATRQVALTVKGQVGSVCRSFRSLSKNCVKERFSDALSSS